MAEESEKKWETDGVAVEDSNMAMVGSDEDKAARKAAAETEQAWVGCGAEPGIEVWRIEQFQVVAWPREEYGNFYKGDAYIVLKTTADPESGKLLYDIHFWLGSECSIDEQGTAAYKTVELDDLKDGLPIQHREVEGHESQDFLQLFPQLNYLEGGVESGFRHVEPDAYIAKLLIVRKHNRTMRVTQVPLARESLNTGDCFILDAGATIYVWLGEDSNPFEKNKCNMVARNLAASRSGKACCVEWDQDPETFWYLLGGEGPIASAEEGDAIVERVMSTEVGEGILYRLSDSSGTLMFTEVARGDVNMGMLDSSDVFILDTMAEVFVWVGAGASDAESRKAMTTATQYLEAYSRPAYTPIHMFKEGQKIRNRIWLDIMRD